MRPQVGAEGGVSRVGAKDEQIVEVFALLQKFVKQESERKQIGYKK